jgi:hypothetical protein
MARKFVFILSIIGLSLITACKDKPQVATYDETFQYIFLSDEGHFRGVSIGDDIETVKKAEKGEQIEEQYNYLLFQDTLDAQDKFDIAYYFDKSGVYTINFRGNFSSEEKSNGVFMNLQDYYTRLYGKPAIQDAYYIWKTKSEKSAHIEIALINHATSRQLHGETVGKEGAFLSLSILNYDY